MLFVIIKHTLFTLGFKLVVERNSMIIVGKSTMLMTVSMLTVDSLIKSMSSVIFVDLRITGIRSGALTKMELKTQRVSVTLLSHMAPELLAPPVWIPIQFTWRRKGIIQRPGRRTTLRKTSVGIFRIQSQNQSQTLTQANRLTLALSWG